MTSEHNNNQRSGEEAQDREGGEVNDVEESADNNQRSGEEAQEREEGGGGGEGDGTEESEGEESQESGAEDVLRRSWKRSKAGHSGDPDNDPYWVGARIPKDILNDIMPVALKEGLSIRQTVVILAAVLISAGVDLEEINLSRSTCHRRLVDSSETIGNNSLNEYIEEVQKNNVGVVCHFDGKIMEQDFKREKENRREPKSRLVFLVKSPWIKGERLVSVPHLFVESGYSVALEVFDQLLHLGVEDQVIGAVYDILSAPYTCEKGKRAAEPVLCLDLP